MMCWDCKFYHIYFGRPFCARSGQMNDEETKRKCKEFLVKKEKQNEY